MSNVILFGEFSSVDEAWEALCKDVDDMCIDNFRFAYADDVAACEEYDERMRNGCCGFADVNVTINGRLAWLGCNYGH